MTIHRCRLRAVRDAAADVARTDNGAQQRNVKNHAEANCVCTVSVARWQIICSCCFVA